eukprot:Pgem_evm1s17662
MEEREYLRKNDWSAEDIEYDNGQFEMNMELLKSHLRVDRIINYTESISEDTGEMTPLYLCKWVGLPYSE